MLTDEELAVLLLPYRERMERISEHYCRLMGEHIRDIGKLSASDIYRYDQLARMGANISTIQAEIAQAAKVTEAEAREIIEAAAKSYTDGLGHFGLDLSIDNPVIRQIVESQVYNTLETMRNLSRTTIVDTAYKSVVDTATQAVMNGVSSYNEAVRKSLKEASRNGVRVRASSRQVFASGYTRRVDTVLRQNILDAANEVANNISIESGKLFDADGVEISAHALCAEDHLPYQGLQYTNADFDELQMSLDRPFGAWNCRHTIYPIIMKVSEPVHTEAELERYKKYSREEIEFGGKSKTRYEWTQEQRRVETEIRYLKDERIAFKASGDQSAVLDTQYRITQYQAYYKGLTEAAGLRIEDKRMLSSIN